MDKQLSLMVTDKQLKQLKVMDKHLKQFVMDKG